MNDTNAARDELKSLRAELKSLRAEISALRAALPSEVKREVERIAPWLYEADCGPLPFACPWCGQNTARATGVPYKIGRNTFQRWRCSTCGGMSTTAPGEQ